ncbi:ribosome biogenesis protein ytm1 [Diatrype stigma]|uniref:Ribosome biogenesis protein ytm1 n=1 Tax=Diatrype stigma TaxID=117547 RepID=A0AAN9UAM4_9PEZI
MASAWDVKVGQALVDFSLYGTFPEEDVSSRHIAVKDIATALEFLAAAKYKLETEIHEINEETAPDVNQWLTNAKSLEEDINRSRTLANEIVRRSEAPDVSGRSIQEAEEKVDFLRQETVYNGQVNDALRSIKHVSGLLDQVEQARDERRILDSLRLLEQSWSALDDIPVSKSCRVMKLLNMRAFELKSAVHDVFDHVWSSLVQVDAENSKVAIFERRPDNCQFDAKYDNLDEQMSLSDAVIGLKAYKEVDQRMALFWRSVDQAIIQPRTDISNPKMPKVITDDSTLHLDGNSDLSITALFLDLERAMDYFAKRLPEELVHSLSIVMMPDLIPRIVTVWLDSAVPSSLSEMDGIQDTVEAARGFCNALQRLQYSGYEELQDWVSNVPHVWISKCRETALDSIRSRLIEGLGDPKEVERVETQTVSKSEGKELAANGAAADDAWAAWSDDDEIKTSNGNGSKLEPTEDDDDGVGNWGWGDEEGTADADASDANKPSQAEVPAEEDDPMEAWGWSDEIVTEEPSTQTQAASGTKPPSRRTEPLQTRELTLKETYNISSMPEPVLALISAILEDGASLVSNPKSPVASEVGGLFSLPTLVLALFQRLADLASNWKARGDLAPRAISMLRLDNDINTLQSFASRAYASEMSTQRTILRDLLGGSHNLLQQDGLDSSDLEAQVDNAISRVRAIAGTWSGILSHSARTQAVGSLVDTIAAKLIADVMDLAGIGQDEAYNIASLIARIEQLDDLFLPPGAGKDAIPRTAQYAASWMRLKFLSEVLQSNLQEVLYLWNESDLSLEFTADEVIDLVRLSFVDNARTRDVIREIESKPHPRGLE